MLGSSCKNPAALLEGAGTGQYNVLHSSGLVKERTRNRHKHRQCGSSGNYYTAAQNLSIFLSAALWERPPSPGVSPQASGLSLTGEEAAVAHFCTLPAFSLREKESLVIPQRLTGGAGIVTPCDIAEAVGSLA